MHGLATMADFTGNTYRCTFTFPTSLAIHISDVAKAMGISQSALLTQMLSRPMADLRGLIATVPDLKSATPEQVLRLRGASVDIIAERVREAMQQISGVK